MPEKSDKAKKAKARDVERRALYERAAHVSANAALNEKHPLALRSYYAGLALHYDKKAQAE